MPSKKQMWTYGCLGIFLLIILGCALWLNCRTYCITFVVSQKQAILTLIIQYAKKISTIAVLFILFKGVQKYIVNKLLTNIMQKLGTTERQTSVTKIINFSLWTLFTFIAISTFIGNVTGLLASLGLVGFGLTFALQKPILNFVGWLTIIFKNIYHEGDRIKINNVVGDVKEIQIMNTIVEGLLESSDVLSGKTISFPNDLILSTDVQNFTKDSNYIVNELSISITYESDYHQAIQLLQGIINNQVTKNQDKYKKNLTLKQSQINKLVSRWIHTSQTKKRNTIQTKKMEHAALENKLKELSAEFTPPIRVEMLDSAIQLIAQFKSPYNEIKKNRTEINVSFLDAVKDNKEIEIAYPHLQIVKTK